MSKLPTPADYIKNFEQLAFGMFVHIGLFSELKNGEWTYFLHHREMSDYEKLSDSFKVGSLKEIVSTAKSAGCKYITFTTRHHEGFSLYDTKGLCDFDIMHCPTGRDLVKEFVEECRAQDIVPFLYHTTLDWYQKDFKENFDKYLDYLYKSVEILCTNYGKIGGFWFDGNWSKKDVDWKEEELYSMIRRYQPDAMIINNTGMNKRGELGCRHIDAVTFERGLPAPLDRSNHDKYISGEMCETLCDHWGIANDLNYKPIKKLIQELCTCRKVGANFLLNIGPNANGSVPLMQKAIMECIGEWMNIYGHAIYNGRPFLWYDNKPEFLLKDVNDESVAYFFLYNWKQASGDENVTISTNQEGLLILDKIPHKIKSAIWMDNGDSMIFTQENDRIFIDPIGFAYGTNLCVRVAKIKFDI